MAMNTYQPYPGGYSHVYRKRRSKPDWAGVGLGDAFKSNIDYYLRLPAQRMFYETNKKVQMAVARQTDTSMDAEFAAKVKPQLSPCYTSYPSTLAAHAAIGLTGYLEYKARVKEKILFIHLAEYLKNPAEHDDVTVEPNVYQNLANVVADCVQTRLLLEDLSRLPSVAFVEIYRLFSASQQTMKFHSLSEIIRAVILYGDILPDWQGQVLHPLTRSLLRDITVTSNQFFDELPHTKPHWIVRLGAVWVRSVCRCLADYLPESENEKDAQKADNANNLRWLQEENKKYRFGNKSEHRSTSGEITPLNGPNPPTLFDPSNTAEQFANSVLNKTLSQDEKELGESKSSKAKDDLAQEIFSKFTKAVEQAGGQQSKWEDMRSDLVERVLRISGFNESPIQGNPADGHAVTLQLGKDLVTSGEIFDRPVELSDDLPAYDGLLEESQPITDALRRTLYPNLMQVPETERFRTSGSLDPARLTMADFSSAVFKRYRIHEKADRRGRPVLLIACDGSGSLNRDQIKMLKILCSAWLKSTAKSDIQVLAGLYHSGLIRQGVSGPLVQWLYHPQKTPSTGRKDAARALVSLPTSGTGAQSDALSLAFMLNEANHLARGRMVYLILISDCAWNRSFHTEKTGEEEVYSYFQTAYEEFPGKLHTTLVALGVSGATGFENLLDRVITVSADQLSDSAAVAKKIGIYVASCMKERHRWLAGR